MLLYNDKNFAGKREKLARKFEKFLGTILKINCRYALK